MKAASDTAERARRRSCFACGAAILSLLAGCESQPAGPPKLPPTTFELDVRFDDAGRSILFGTTNLPPKTMLQGGVTEARPSGLSVRRETTVSEGGTFEFAPLEVPPGRFAAHAMMRVSAIQPESVIATIGEAGGRLQGDLVRNGPGGAFVIVERELSVPAADGADAERVQLDRALADFRRIVELERRVNEELESIEWIRSEARYQPTTRDPGGILQRWLVGHAARVRDMLAELGELQKSASCPSLRKTIELEAELVKLVVESQGGEYYRDRVNVAGEIEANRSAIDSLASYLGSRLEPAVVAAARAEATARAEAIYRAPKLGEPIPAELLGSVPTEGPPPPPLPETSEAPSATEPADGGSTPASVAPPKPEAPAQKPEDAAPTGGKPAPNAPQDGPAPDAKGAPQNGAAQSPKS